MGFDGVGIGAKGGAIAGVGHTVEGDAGRTLADAQGGDIYAVARQKLGVNG